MEKTVPNDTGDDTPTPAETATYESFGETLGFYGPLAIVGRVLQAAINWPLQRKQNKALQEAKKDLQAARATGSVDQTKIAKTAVKMAQKAKNRAGILNRIARGVGKINDWLENKAGEITLRAGNFVLNLLRRARGIDPVPFVEGGLKVARFGKAALVVEGVGGQIGWDIGGDIAGSAAKAIHLGKGATGWVKLGGSLVGAAVGVGVSVAAASGGMALLAGAGIVGAPAAAIVAVAAVAIYEGYAAVRSGISAWRKNGGYISFKSFGDFCNGIKKGFGGNFSKDFIHELADRSGWNLVTRDMPHFVTHDVPDFFTKTLPGWLGFGGKPQAKAAPAPQPQQPQAKPVAAAQPVVTKPDYRGQQKPSMSASGLRAATTPTNPSGDHRHQAKTASLTSKSPVKQRPTGASVVV